MPPICAYEDRTGLLVVYDGVTRATRIAKLAPGETVTVEVIGRIRRDCSNLPTIEELLP